jgi:glycosyltransferase involved in cell wall biosynthesis
MTQSHSRQLPAISIILPAKNEERGLRGIIPRINELYPDAEVIVVDDGSTDSTAELCKTHGVRILRHPYGMGNGAAVKTGARAALGRTLVFLDADGQHDPADIDRLLVKLSEGYDMVVGARQRGSQASFGRSWANRFYNRLSSWIVGQRIADLTSGFRAAQADKFREFLYLLPNGFSYPTTSTMAFFRAGYGVAYVPITARKRIGTSHIRPMRDAIRFLLIIFKVGTLYSPLKIFAPISMAFFALGLFHYTQTFIATGRLTNMSALLFVTSVLVLLIGLISEQITALVYRR